jgi:hypothetical protein
VLADLLEAAAWHGASTISLLCRQAWLEGCVQLSFSCCPIVAAGFGNCGCFSGAASLVVDLVVHTVALAADLVVHALATRLGSSGDKVECLWWVQAVREI